MVSSFQFRIAVISLPLVVMGCLSLSCDGKQGPAGPPGQSVTMLVTATPVPLNNRPFLGQWGVAGTGNGQLNQPQGVALDGLGNVYVSDTYNHRVQKFTSAGGFIAVWGGPMGANPGQFYYPCELSVDKAGNLYVADSGNNRVQELPVDMDGTVSANWATWGGPVSGTAPGQFNQPKGITVDDAGNLYVADTNNHRVQELQGATWVTMGGTASGSNPGQFYYPQAIQVDGAGNLYVSDTTNHRIQKLPTGLDGTVPSNWVTFGSLGSTNPGQFYYPIDVAVDNAGDLYVADNGNNRIQELPAGRAATVSANWVTLGGPASGSAPGQFYNPFGVTLDNAGNLYVADTNNYRVQKFGP